MNFPYSFFQAMLVIPVKKVSPVEIVTAGSFWGVYGSEIAAIQAQNTVLEHGLMCRTVACPTLLVLSNIFN